MTHLNELLFSKIKPEKQYLFYRDNYQRSICDPHTISLASGQEIIEEICDIFGFDEEESTLEEFLLTAQDSNGEDDYIQIFDIPVVK